MILFETGSVWQEFSPHWCNFRQGLWHPYLFQKKASLSPTLAPTPVSTHRALGSPRKTKGRSLPFPSTSREATLNRRARRQSKASENCFLDALLRLKLEHQGSPNRGPIAAVHRPWAVVHPMEPIDRPNGIVDRPAGMSQSARLTQTLSSSSAAAEEAICWYPLCLRHVGRAAPTQLTGSWGLACPSGTHAREDACMQELVERHPMGSDPFRAHLLRQLLSFVEATRVEVCLEQRVVTHNVQAVNLFHLSKCLRAPAVSPQATNASSKQLYVRRLTARPSIVNS